ncbi:hypothetical protein AVEN_131577-1 [Araneus ventricosus]|uniref:Uncharacterized protein n=1 Tax=Araneus ventricosus TaxID=182803 RepID=A0A4Y2H4Y5_ARAVE|nr:hypothetical protein AVEN_131577-1 [Araneus ventricosus]
MLSSAGNSTTEETGTSNNLVRTGDRSEAAFWSRIVTGDRSEAAFWSRTGTGEQKRSSILVEDRNRSQGHSSDPVDDKREQIGNMFYCNRRRTNVNLVVYYRRRGGCKW